jgi:hypothetical protein
MIENDVSNMVRINVKGDVDGQRAKSRSHVLYRLDLPPFSIGIFIRWRNLLHRIVGDSESNYALSPHPDGGSEES